MKLIKIVSDSIKIKNAFSVMLVFISEMAFAKE